jgi:hypothetical protein
MSDLKIKGKLIKKFEPQTYGESFRKMVYFISLDVWRHEEIGTDLTQPLSDTPIISAENTDLPF